MSTSQSRIAVSHFADRSWLHANRGPLLFAVVLAGATLVLLHPQAIHIYRGWWHMLAPARSVGDAGGYLAHSICYATLAAVGVWLLPRAWHVWFWGALMVHGVVTELIQRLIPGRTFDLADIACNIIAASASFAIASIWMRFKQPHYSNQLVQ